VNTHTYLNHANVSGTRGQHFGVLLSRVMLELTEARKDIAMGAPSPISPATIRTGLLALDRAGVELQAASQGKSITLEQDADMHCADEVQLLEAIGYDPHGQTDGQMKTLLRAMRAVLLDQAADLREQGHECTASVSDLTARAAVVRIRRQAAGLTTEQEREEMCEGCVPCRAMCEGCPNDGLCAYTSCTETGGTMPC